MGLIGEIMAELQQDVKDKKEFDYRKRSQQTAIFAIFAYHD